MILMHKSVWLIGMSWLITANSSFAQASKIAFWNEQRKGANWFNDVPTSEWLIAAKAAGITLVRLAPNKWKTAQRDFLIGNADHYENMVEPDFAKLKETLDQAEAVGIKIVLTTLSLPGARWRQQNNDKPDLRLWQEPRYSQQAARFWRELASRLKNHPAIAGYNILNEPTPELITGLRNSHAQNFADWHTQVKNTAADLNRFYVQVVAAIRAVDQEPPIVLDGGFWASADALPFLAPLPDEKILQLVVDWQRQHPISADRIFVGEFGCNRTVKGAANYLEDLIAIFNQRQWHWAFYSFREDSWDGMNYELGAKPPGAAYWEAKARGENPTLPRVKNPIWDTIKKESVAMRQ